MLIKNYKELAVNSRTKTTLNILEAGLDVAKPKKSIAKFVKPNKIIIGRKSYNFQNIKSVYLVAFGKAAYSMSKAFDSILKVKGGIIVVPKGSLNKTINKKFQVFHAGHPLPNNRSILAAKSIMNFLHQRKNNEFVVFLISGGGSSLISMPAGISLHDKILVNNLLLKSGATIQEFNCIRKHLSQIKGGLLVENIKCHSLALVMSDVENDDLSSISSGCTYYDPTTFSNALQIIKKYNLTHKMPKSVLKRLESGSIGKIRETPKKPYIKNQIIATNKNCLHAMAKKAQKLGYQTKTVKISGDVVRASKKLTRYFPKKKNSCLIFGGEPTVFVRGKGKGGRNQELVLHLLKNTQKIKSPIIISSMGTDGIDGNTENAGAIVETFQISNKKINSYLKKNDSNSFFKKYGGLINTGYTHTNLQDIGVILN